jgi:hypothetical protein
VIWTTLFRPGWLAIQMFRKYVQSAGMMKNIRVAAGCAGISLGVTLKNRRVDDRPSASILRATGGCSRSAAETNR